MLGNVGGGDLLKVVGLDDLGAIAARTAAGVGARWRSSVARRGRPGRSFAQIENIALGVALGLDGAQLLNVGGEDLGMGVLVWQRDIGFPRQGGFNLADFLLGDLQGLGP